MHDFLQKTEMVHVIESFGEARRAGGDLFDKEPRTDLWLYANGASRVGLYLWGAAEGWNLSIFSAIRVRMHPCHELHQFVARWRTTVKLGAPYVVEEESTKLAAVMCEVGFRRQQIAGEIAALELAQSTVDTVADVSDAIGRSLAQADGIEFTSTGVTGARLMLSWWEITDPRIEGLL